MLHAWFYCVDIGMAGFENHKMYCSIEPLLYIYGTYILSFRRYSIPMILICGIHNENDNTKFKHNRFTYDL